MAETITHQETGFKGQAPKVPFFPAKFGHFPACFCARMSATPPSGDAMRRLALLGLALAVFALPWAALAQSVDVDLVVLVDTSASVRDDVDRLCTELPKVIQSIGGDGLAVRWRVFSIKDTYNCAKDTVQATIPGSAVADDEDWGIAIAELAAGYAWQPSASRLIIPLSDSGPASGNPVSDPGPDRDVTTLAIRAAIANKVILSPLLSGPAPDTSADDRARLEAVG